MITGLIEEAIILVCIVLIISLFFPTETHLPTSCRQGLTGLRTDNLISWGERGGERGMGRVG